MALISGNVRASWANLCLAIYFHLLCVDEGEKVRKETKKSWVSTGDSFKCCSDILVHVSPCIFLGKTETQKSSVSESTVSLPANSHHLKDVFCIYIFSFTGILLPLWHWAPFSEPVPLMLNHVDIKVFPWLTRHDMSGNIQPRSKMELVKGLHTTTNSLREKGIKRKNV